MPETARASSTPAPAAPARVAPATQVAPARTTIAQAPVARLGPNGLRAGPPAVRLGDGGEPLVPPVRQRIERSLGADLSGVRLHADASSAQAARAVSARAFVQGSNIFLGSGTRRDDLGLIAHEAAHTIQQSSAPAFQPFAPRGGDGYEREAQTAAEAVVRGERFSVTSRTTAGQVQRLGLSDVLDHFANAANNIPGFAMLTFVLGFNPINMQRVERNATNLFRAIIGFLPGGELIFQALQRHGILDRVGAWAQQQLNTLGAIGDSIRAALRTFLDSLGFRDIFRLGDVWERAKRIFTEPIGRIINFVRGLAADIIKFIKDAILRPVARLAEGTRGYELLKLVLGEDPITGDPYPRTPANMIGGFMRLIGQEEKWQYLQQSRAVPRAWAWFQQQLSTLLGFVRQIPQLFIRLWQSLQVSDLLDIGGAFNKVRTIFGGFVSNFVTWAANAALQILQFIFEVLAPGAMPILRRAAAVFRTIISDPVRFVGNLVRAGVQGFRQFSANIRTHLINGLVGWLTGALSGAGLQLPARWDLRGILSLVLQILGLTWQNIRQKLVRALGETTVRVLETTFDIVVTLVREGPAAAWQKILEQLSNLQEMVFGQIRDWVARTVVGQAVIRIASMLNPAGAVIQAIIAIYNTIMFVRERLQQIMAVAEAFFNSIAQIAAGAIGAAATYVENTMARLVPVVISFLARLIGLGGISDTIRNIIARIRAPIDRALDRLVDWIVGMARRVGQAIMGVVRRAAQTGVPQDPRARLQEGMQAAVAVVRRLPGNRIGRAIIAPALGAIKLRYGFQLLEPFARGRRWWLRGRVNPDTESETDKEESSAGPVSFNVGNMIKARYVDGFWVAQITAKTDALVSFRFADPRKGTKTLTAEEFAAAASSSEIQGYIADRRGMFMGSNPSRDGPVGQAVKAHYQANPLLYRVGGTPPVEQVKYPMRANGRWVAIADCDLSHEPEDAVTYWNREAYKYGPRSPEVRAFMTNPNNYIFEPSSINRSRASRHGESYRDPYKE